MVWQEAVGTIRVQRVTLEIPCSSTEEGLGAIDMQHWVGLSVVWCVEHCLDSAF